MQLLQGHTLSCFHADGICLQRSGLKQAPCMSRHTSQSVEHVPLSRLADDHRGRVQGRQEDNLEKVLALADQPHLCRC